MWPHMANGIWQVWLNYGCDETIVLLELSRWVWCKHSGPYKREHRCIGEGSGVMNRAEMEAMQCEQRRGVRQGTQHLARSWKGHGNRFPSQSLQKKPALLPPHFYPCRTQFRLLTPKPQDNKLVLLKLLSVGKFVTAATGYEYSLGQIPIHSTECWILPSVRCWVFCLFV